ncbi:MAG: glycosyltransferase family 4 protein [Phycisphaerae bacterium]|nr:glycosyltransferase family 4 protein [Phycisphaerae bacterium]
MLALVLTTGLVAALLTAAFRHYALARNVVDIPNARSSHAVPTPRGGGAAIVLSTALAVIWLYAAGALTTPLVLVVSVGGGLVALIGFIDDHGHLAARWRLLGHFAAAAWTLAWIDGLPLATIPGLAQLPAWAGWGLSSLFLVWMLNLFNFMDGIDGIASVEAVSTCLGGALLYALSGQAQAACLPLALAAAAGGFLLWNWPPARIFMGDVGSGFLGLMLGILSLQAGGIDPTLFWAWVVLMGVFIADATLTLGRRLLRGEQIHQAHRSHAYQHAARRHGRHLPVTLATACINLLWLLPIALGVATASLSIPAGLVLAYVPLGALALAYGAGAHESRAR